MFRTHISVNPDLASNRLVRDFVARHVGNIDLRHVETSSDQGLPGLVAERCQVELALIDGNHSHPFPLLDFHYIDQMLARDGLLLIDNTEIHAVQELTEYLEMEPAYRLDRLIGNCAVYRKVKDRQLGWKAQTIRRPSEGVDAVRHELTRLRMEVAPDLRASLNGAAPLPPAPVSPTRTTETQHRQSVVGVRRTRRQIGQMARWYASPSGALAGVALLLLAVGLAAPGLWRLVAVVGVVLLAAFLPYRFIREQRRTDRREAVLRGQIQSTVHESRRLEGELQEALSALRDQLATTQRELRVIGETIEAESARITQLETRMTPSRRFAAARPSEHLRPELTMRDATTALHRSTAGDEPA